MRRILRALALHCNKILSFGTEFFGSGAIPMNAGTGKSPAEQAHEIHRYEFQARASAAVSDRSGSRLRYGRPGWRGGRGAWE
jgi:hypothetical protein